MLVSIIIPVYNSCKYVEKCVRSVFDQTYKNLEIIIVDDCGKDGSIDIIKRVLIEYPSVAAKVRFIYHEFNQGCASSRCDGMKEATGKYILQVDSDDYIAPTMVEELVAKAEKDDSDMVVCNYYYNYGNRRTEVNIKPPKDNLVFVSKVLEGYIHAGAWNKLMRRSILKENNIYPVPGINMGDDMTILLQALFYLKRISYVDNYLYYYNCSGDERLSRSIYPIVNDIKLIELIQNFFNNQNIIDKGVEHSFNLFKIGRLGRNLLYNDLDDVNRYKKVFGIEHSHIIFEHKRMPLHYKLVSFCYIKKYTTVVKLLRWLIRYNKNRHVQ